MKSPLGWARSKILYNRLKSRDYLTPLEEAFMILVEIKKEQLNLLELQLQAICGINEHNKSVLEKTLKEYARMVMPHSDKKEIDEESFEVKAKKQLTEEIKNAFIVKKKEEVNLKDLKKNTDAAFIGAKYFKEKELNTPTFRKSTSKTSKDIIKINK
jgi:hypothetical protein